MYAALLIRTLWAKVMLWFSGAPKEPDQDLRRTSDTVAAVHEAGHATAAWFSIFTESIDSLLIRPDGSGQIVYAVYATKKPESHILWCDMVVALSGFCAEGRVFGRFRSEQCSKDLVEARRCAELVVGTNPPWKPQILRTIKFHEAYQDPVKDDVREALQIGYTMACTLLETHNSKMLACAKRLLGKKTLTEADLQEIFGKRSYRILAPFESTGFWY